MSERKIQMMHKMFGKTEGKQCRDDHIRDAAKMVWIPISERLPDVDEDGYSDYVLLSFENSTLPTIGIYVQDKDGSGAFHDGDDERTLASYGLFVNA